MTQVLNLSKGASILNLRKSNGDKLSRVIVKLFWDETGPRAPYDLDATSILANADHSNPADFGKATDISEVCFYGQPQTQYMKHLKGDNRNGQDAPGAENASDEEIEINLSAITHANTVPVFITINDEKNLGQSFDEVKAPRVEVVDADTGVVLATADLLSLPAKSTGAIFVVFKKNAAQEWSIENVSTGFPGKNLGDFLGLYGINTTY